MSDKKIIVAVHGIGDQIGYATAQSVAYQFCRYYKRPAAIPLGRFHKLAPDGAHSVPSPILITSPPDPELPGGLGFAEVYWADIPRTVVKEGYVLEEAKRWARTIVGRYRLQSKSEEVTRLETVLEELIETVFVLERVTWVLYWAGILKYYSLRKLLEGYLGGVQLVADFETYREKILEHFYEVMRKALKLSEAGQAELYLVAHSEGSVIAFLGILTAWSQPEKYEWVKSIRGLMTIGSPIETHHILWPNLWQTLRPSAPAPDERIKWWNYLDSGDPIAYPLDKTREWLNKAEEGVPPWSAYFEFEKKEEPNVLDYFESENEKGPPKTKVYEKEFSRYYFPGIAHIDYWDDADLFGHFIQNVVRVPDDQQRSDESAPRDFSDPPEDRWSAKVVSVTVPGLLVFGLLFAAVFFLYIPVVTALWSEPHARDVFLDVGGLALLLFGMTSAVRIPILTKDWRWRVGSVLILWATVVLYPLVSSWQGPGTLFGGDFRTIFGEYSHTRGLLWGLLVAVAVIAQICDLVARWRPKWGVRILPAAGVLLAALLVWRLLVVSEGDQQLDVWPVLLGGALFFYLWWLATLLFDLTFVWHYYVRWGDLAQQLREDTEEAHDTTAPANG